MDENIRALLLFSGGLDSLIAAKLLQEQKIELLGLTIYIPYFDIEPAKKQAKKINLPLRIIDISEEHLEILKNPQHGYGKNMNPCIDCHALMIKKAKEVMEKEDYSFVATGEVLEERPMSQNRIALNLVEKESGINGYLLRPLSAKLLKPTIPEEKRWVDRDKLLDIQGRSRKKQIELAKKFGLKEYPTPSGGCLLTDPQFSERLKDLFDKKVDVSVNDVELLKYGRRFWEDDNLIVVGRYKEDNEMILDLAQENDLLLELNDYPGPTTLIRGKNPKSSLKKAAELTKHYSSKTRDLESVKIKFWENEKSKLMIVD